MSEFQFPSRPIHVAVYTEYQVYSKVITLECGSMYEQDGTGEYKCIYTHYVQEKPKKPISDKLYIKKEKKEYTEEFLYMWKIWTDNVKNSSNKANSFTNFEKLTKEQKTELCYSIDPYARTSNEHKYLKRCESYISSRHFEQVVQFEQESKEIIPKDSDPIWSTEIFNQATGITEKAGAQVARFGMYRAEAYQLIRETLDI